MSTRPLVERLLAARLSRSARGWMTRAVREIESGVSDDRFCALLSMASRHARRRPLSPTGEELEAAGAALPGWCPERWNVLETLRAGLVLARSDLVEESGAAAVEEGFRYADEGELCALYRCLGHLPQPERFRWRAGEGCRTNMVTVFEATALDTPYPERCFEDEAFHQAVIKCLFVGAPLWRLYGLDRRLSPELARMALDLADERRSAGRPVQHELWLCLGTHGGDRGLAALLLEFRDGSTLGRCAAAYGLARAGATDQLQQKPGDERVAAAVRDALEGHTGQGSFRALDPRES